MEQINPFILTKLLTSIALGEIFKGLQRDGIEIKTAGFSMGLMRCCDFGHNEKTFSFQFYFQDTEEDVLSFVSVNAEKEDGGKLFLNITFNLEDKRAQEYMDKKKLQEDYVTRDDKGTTRKTITYSYIFSKKSLSAEIFKNIKGSL